MFRWPDAQLLTTEKTVTQILGQRLLIVTNNRVLSHADTPTIAHVIARLKMMDSSARAKFVYERYIQNYPGLTFMLDVLCCVRWMRIYQVVGSFMATIDNPCMFRFTDSIQSMQRIIEHLGKATDKSGLNIDTMYHAVDQEIAYYIGQFMDELWTMSMYVEKHKQFIRTYRFMEQHVGYRMDWLENPDNFLPKETSDVKLVCDKIQEVFDQNQFMYQEFQKEFHDLLSVLIQQKSTTTKPTTKPTTKSIDKPMAKEAKSATSKSSSKRVETKSKDENDDDHDAADAANDDDDDGDQERKEHDDASSSSSSKSNPVDAKEKARKNIQTLMAKFHPQNSRNNQKRKKQKSVMEIEVEDHEGDKPQKKSHAARNVSDDDNDDDADTTTATKRKPKKISAKRVDSDEEELDY